MIIIFGGAFNPPTKAHYLIANELIEKFNPDKFYFLPVGEKYNKPGMESFSTRFEMTKLLANKLINCEVSTKENESTFRGTYYMLKDFSLIDSDLYFVMGADNFDYLDNWIMADKLISEFKFIILTREGFDVSKLIENKYYNHRENFHIVNIELPISSTNFRGTKNKDLLIDEVYEYIKSNHIYGVK